MKNFINAFILGVLICSGLFLFPYTLSFIGLKVGSLILLIVVSLLVGLLSEFVLKIKLTDVVCAVACLVYAVLYMVVTSVLDYSNSGIVTFNDKLLLGLGGAFLVFVALSLVGKVFEKKK